MDLRPSDRQWPIIKYKQVKRSGREEYQNVYMLLSESKRTLVVFQGTEELELVYLRMETSKYPMLKIRGPQLYVMVNSSNQGFRLTFRNEDRAQFMATIRKISFISETPEKNHLNRTFTNIDSWGLNSGKKKPIVSSSQPISSFDNHSSASKKPAMRNLAQSFQSDFFTGINRKHPASSQTTFYSQPTHNPYTRPLSSASSISSSINSAMSSLNDDSPMYSFSQCSSSSSSYMPATPTHFSGSPVSDKYATSYTNLASGSPLSWSQQSSDPFTQPFSAAISDNKSVQTDSNIIDKLVEDPIFIEKFLEKLMKSPKLADLVRDMRTHIRKLPSEKLEEFNKATNPLDNRNTMSSNSIQPSMTQQTSDLEFDVFANI